MLRARLRLRDRLGLRLLPAERAAVDLGCFGRWPAKVQERTAGCSPATGVAGGTDAGVCADADSPQVKVAAISNANSTAAGGQWRGDRERNMVSV